MNDDLHAYGDTVRSWTRGTIATFSSHWQACAALIRLTDPGFRSLGGDPAPDLGEEARMRERLMKEQRQ